MTRLAPFADAELRALADLAGRADGPVARRLYLELRAELDARQPVPPPMSIPERLAFLDRRRMA